MHTHLRTALGYGLDEELPWHSTVSRTRQLYPPALFEQLFDRVFALCVAQGLVAGDTQAVDSAPVKANAALESLQPKQPAETATAPAPHAAAVLSAPAHQLRNEATRQAKRQAAPGAPGASHPKTRLLSNKTHYSTTDPDARVSVKPGKARALNYLCSLAMDTATSVISHVQADFADSRDSLHLPGIVRQLLPRLRAQGLLWRDVLGDAGYANGFNYALLEEQGLTDWIPVFGQYKPEVEGFRYDLATDTYTCAAGKPLPFQKYDTTAAGGWLKIYWAAYQDCKQCPLKATCVPTARRKQLTRTAYDPAYRRAWARQQSRRGQAMRRRSQSTVEPVFGHLIHHYDLRRVNTRGRASAHKTMLLAAVAYNLKKLLKHRPSRPWPSRWPCPATSHPGRVGVGCVNRVNRKGAHMPGYNLLARVLQQPRRNNCETRPFPGNNNWYGEEPQAELSGIPTDGEIIFRPVCAAAR